MAGTHRPARVLYGRVFVVDYRRNNIHCAEGTDGVAKYSNSVTAVYLYGVWPHFFSRGLPANVYNIVVISFCTRCVSGETCETASGFAGGDGTGPARFVAGQDHYA